MLFLATHVLDKLLVTDGQGFSNFMHEVSTFITMSVIGQENW